MVSETCWGFLIVGVMYQVVGWFVAFVWFKDGWGWAIPLYLSFMFALTFVLGIIGDRGQKGVRSPFNDPNKEDYGKVKRRLRRGGEDD